MKKNWYVITVNSDLIKVGSFEEDGFEQCEEWSESTGTDVLWIMDESSVQSIQGGLIELVNKGVGTMSLNEDETLTYYPTDIGETAHLLADSNEISNFLFSVEIAESFLKTINN